MNLNWAWWTRRANLLSWIAVLSSVAGGCYWLAAAPREAQREGLRPVSLVRGTLESVVTAAGKLEPKQYVEVGAQVSGQLKKMHVQIGDTVRAGQLLAEIDRRAYESQLETEQARLNRLRASLGEQQAQRELAERSYDRNRKLAADDAISPQVLQESEAEASVAEARVAETRAAIQELRANLAGLRASLQFTRIRAPMSGTVTGMPAHVGQLLAANPTAPAILQIANLDTMTVRAQVAEAEVARLGEGMSADFTTLADAERRWRGTVRQILPSPELVSDVVLYNVLIDVANADHRLMTGMSAQVFFPLGKVEDVPILPAEALGARVPERDDGTGKAYRVQVWKKGSGAQQQIVHIGLQTRTQVQITAGLEEGEQVAVKRLLASE